MVKITATITDGKRVYVLGEVTRPNGTTVRFYRRADLKTKTWMGYFGDMDEEGTR